MTMTIPPRTEENNVVILNSFVIDNDSDTIRITFTFGYRNGGNINTTKKNTIILDNTKFNQLLNATPPGNKTFKEWIRPLIYGQIAAYLGVPVGDID